MTLNSSGPISLAGTTAGQSIEIENGGNGTTQISLNDSAVRTLAGTSYTTPGSTIQMPTNFYGKANAFTLTISSNKTNLCVRAAAVTAGWNQSSNLTVVVNSGIIVSANSTGTPGMTVSGTFPGGISIKNNGYIIGMGGGGGYGGNWGCCCSSSPPSGGCSGGTALYVRSAVTICNSSGVIGGGGGGGGAASSFGGHGGAGGGGGRTGSTNSPGGGAGGSYYQYGQPGGGGAGTFAGAGGPGSQGYNPYGAGGGGGWGASGTGACSGPGGGGAATCGASGRITWSANGTRYGSIN